MRKIKTFDDVRYIIEHKVDVYDFKNNKVDFVRFLGMRLVDLINDVFPNDWYYYTEV